MRNVKTNIKQVKINLLFKKHTKPLFFINILGNFSVIRLLVFLR